MGHLTEIGYHLPYIISEPKKKLIMGMIADNRKFKRTVTQENPTNPTGNVNITTNRFDIDERTIKDQQNKR